MSRTPSVLISTLAPLGGGVPQMTAFISEIVSRRGIKPVFAFYQPYSVDSHLSAPIHKILTRSPDSRQVLYLGSVAHAIGARLPELEFRHYWPSLQWRKLILENDYHIAVSGNCLAATPYMKLRVTFWAWVATDWKQDRIQRANQFPFHRRVVDRFLNGLGARYMEKKILTSRGTVVALSDYTKNALNSISKRGSINWVLPMGIDTDIFKPRDMNPRENPAVGFVGRLDDPRKNIELLLESVAHCRKTAPKLSLTLVGAGTEDSNLKRKVAQLGLTSFTTMVPYCDNNRLPEHLSSLSAFVVPSHQEGLCIAGLEAMSCGVPVISTRCGGPEEYITDGVNGYLVDPNPARLSEAISKIVSNPELQRRLGGNARRTVLKKYSKHSAEQIFWSSFVNTYPDLEAKQY